MEDICSNECTTKKRNISKIVLSTIYVVIFAIFISMLVAYAYTSKYNIKILNADNLKNNWNIKDIQLSTIMAIIIFASIVLIGSLIGYASNWCFIINAGIGRYIVATTIAFFATMFCDVSVLNNGKDLKIQSIGYLAVKNLSVPLKEAGFVAFFACVGLMGGYYLYKQAKIEWKKILKITLINLAICTGLIFVLFATCKILSIITNSKLNDANKMITNDINMSNLALAISNGSLMSLLGTGGVTIDNANKIVNNGSIFGNMLATPIGAIGFLTVCSIVFANMQRIIKSKKYNNNDARVEQPSFKIDAIGVSVFMLSAAIGYAIGHLSCNMLKNYVNITLGPKLGIIITASIASIVGVICNISLLPQNSILGIIKQLAAAMFLSGAGLMYHNVVSKFRTTFIDPTNVDNVNILENVFNIKTEHKFVGNFVLALFTIILIVFGLAIAILPTLLSMKLCGGDEAYEAFIVKSEQEKTCSLWGMHTYLVIINVLGSVVCVNLVSALAYHMFF